MATPPHASSPMPAAAAPVRVTTAPVPVRLTSIDAYRGLVMVLMAAELLHLPRIAASFQDSFIWQTILSHTTHREWVGCSLHDLIQPSFTFLVGAVLPFSIASRMKRGQPFPAMLGHAVVRSFLLIFLGIFLRSTSSTQTNFTFEDTLTQIGLGYTFAFLLAFAPVRAQWGSLALVLGGYWLAFALYPLPGPGFDWQKAGVAADWPHHLRGFAQHWDKNSNLAAAFDQWFLNLFPRSQPFSFNRGGYVTLSFIPTLGTMLFGLLAGQWLRESRTGTEKVSALVRAGVICLLGGTMLHVLGICPLVKRIWTPTWTIFSAGWCFLFLAAFYAVIDLKGYQRWAFPLVVVGMNSITMYCLVHLVDGFILKSLQIHLGEAMFKVFGDVYEPAVKGAAVLVVLWLILLWMHRRKLYLRI